jgi:hypothetical protein
LVCEKGWEAEQASSSWGTAPSAWLWGVDNNTPCHVNNIAATSRIVALADDFTDL